MGIGTILLFSFRYLLGEVIFGNYRLLNRLFVCWVLGAII